MKMPCVRRKVNGGRETYGEESILCCQAYHAARALLYYQICFPETEFFVCPVVTKGISRENWYQTETGRKLVLTEVEHCGSQFGTVLAEFAERN